MKRRRKRHSPSRISRGTFALILLATTLLGVLLMTAYLAPFIQLKIEKSDGRAGPGAAAAPAPFEAGEIVRPELLLKPENPVATNVSARILNPPATATNSN